MTSKRITLFALALSFGALTAGCEQSAKGDVRIEPKRVEIDASEANRELKRAGRKISDTARRAAESETVQRAEDAAEEAAKEAGREIKKGAREAAEETGEVLEKAGRELQERSGKDEPEPKR